MTKLSLGQAARAAGVAKTTLTRMIQRGELSAERGADGSYAIDPSEVARVQDIRSRPRRGLPVKGRAGGAPADVPAGTPVRRAPGPDPLAELLAARAELAALRDHLAAVVRQAQDAEARAAEALARERALADRLTASSDQRLITDQRENRPGFLRRLLG